MVDLVEGLDSLIPSGAASYQQHPHLFHWPVPQLRGPRCLTRQRSPSGRYRIGRVRFAFPVPELPVGSIDFDDLDAVVVEEPGEPGAVRSGALDTDPGHRSEAFEPSQQPGVAGLGGWERLDPQQPADVIQRRRYMEVEMRVHPATNGTGIYDGHQPSLSLANVCKGVARTTATADVDAVEAVVTSSTDVTPPEG
jgi:hypothetical protein